VLHGVCLAAIHALPVVQGLGLRRVLPVLGERRAVMLGVAGLAVATVLYISATQTWMVYLAIAVGSLEGFVQASISGLNSQAVDARSQGELQGAAQSVGSIAQIVCPPLYAQTLAHCSGPGAWINLPMMPMVLSTAFGLIALALFLKGASLLDHRAPA
jgi:DHA1 family tetracycline resistance protein-like MFS transporter